MNTKPIKKPKKRGSRGKLSFPRSAFHAIVVGASAGGGQALIEIISRLPSGYSLPILVVQHLHPNDNGGFAEHIAGETELSVVTPCDKQKIEQGHVYVAPANYHMLVERNGAIALSTEGRVNWARPSIDILFESAAHVWDEKVIAVLLSGANSDGTEGVHTVKALGGLTVAQDPVTAENPVMPQSAIDAGVVDMVLTLENIGDMLIEIGMRNE